MEKQPKLPSPNAKENLFRANKVAELLSQGKLSEDEAIALVLESDGVTEMDEVEREAKYIKMMLPATPTEVDTTPPQPIHSSSRRVHKAMLIGAKQAERSRRDDRFPPD